MNNNLMVFEGKQVEVFEFEGDVLFNPYHVGKCLDLSESTVRNYIATMNDKQVKLLKNSDVRDTDIRKLNNAGEKFLKEAGVYKLVFKSRKPEAERFQDWVTDEVLPAIRQNGFYFNGMSKELQAIFTLDKKQQVTERKINAVAEDLKDFKENAPLFSIECEELQKALKKKLVHLLGGKQSPAYRDNSIRQKAFIDAQHQIKREFAVSSYKGIKRVHFEKALEIIENYTLPTALQEVVTALNCQVSIQNMMIEKDNLIRGAFGK